MIRLALAGVLGTSAAACNPASTQSVSTMDEEPVRPEPSITPTPVEPSADTPVAAAPATGPGFFARPGDAGTFVVERRYSQLVQARPIAFGPSWQWAALKPADELAKTRAAGFRLDLANLPAALHGTYEPIGNVLRIRVRLEVRETLRGISGIGFEFRLADAAQLWGVPKPGAKIEGAGFVAPTDEAPIAVEFAGHRPRLYFERKDPKVVRAMLVEGDVAPGSYETVLTVQLPEGGIATGPVHTRYDEVELARWHANTVPWDAWPIDVRGMAMHHRPAGKHGRLQVKGDRLVFADGTPARLWGTNVVAASLFRGTEAAICQQAERLAALGYNLVRLHHHDSGWVGQNVFTKAAADTQSLERASLDRLDYWLSCLKAQGIYVWVDLHVGRPFRAGDRIDGFDELVRTQKGEAKGFLYVNDRIEALMQRFAAEYLTRRNRYTGTTWAQDEAVVGVLITNENDLSDHFGPLMLPEKGNPVHQRRFEALTERITKDLGLPPQAKRIWEPGPGKVLLAELQHRFDARAIAHLRKLGVKAPIATTNYWGRNSMYALAPLLAGDVIDVHSYGEAEELGTNPRHQSNFIHFIAGAQVVGRPLTVTEWNVPPPARDRFVAPMWIASIAALQGWDALMMYAHSMGPMEPPRNINKWSAWNDPALLALAPAAAIAYRRGDVAMARETVVLAPSVDVFYGERRNAETSAAIRTAAERSRLLIEPPDHPAIGWDKREPRPKGAQVVTDLDRDLLAADAHRVVSDTGEITRDWALGIQLVDTPRTQSAAGFLGGQTIELGDAMIELRTAKATVVFTSLDDLPLRESKAVLVTVVARAEPDGATYRAEPVRGRIGLRSQHRGLVMVPLPAGSRADVKGLLGPSGPTGKAAGVPQDRAQTGRAEAGGRIVFELRGDVATHWFVIRPS